MEEALANTGVPIYAVMPARAAVLAPIAAKLDLGMAVLCDPDWSAHRALHLHRGGVRDVLFSRQTWKSYARSLGEGRLEVPKQDIWQLGGAAVVGGEGEIFCLHRSETSTDYASPAGLRRAVERYASD